jgi:hypothetical protein
MIHIHTQYKPTCSVTFSTHKYIIELAYLSCTHITDQRLQCILFYSLYMSQRTEGHNHVLDKIQSDKKFRTERKTLQLTSFMNLYFNLVRNGAVSADRLISVLIDSIFDAKFLF